jgi:hypothetical protein
MDYIVNVIMLQHTRSHMLFFKNELDLHGASCSG